MSEPDNACFQHVLSRVQTESEKNTKQVKRSYFFMSLNLPHVYAMNSHIRIAIVNRKFL